MFQSPLVTSPAHEDSAKEPAPPIKAELRDEDMALINSLQEQINNQETELADKFENFKSQMSDIEHRLE